jgi:hypothetical protein
VVSSFKKFSYCVLIEGQQKEGSHSSWSGAVDLKVILDSKILFARCIDYSWKGHSNAGVCEKIVKRVECPKNDV